MFGRKVNFIVYERYTDLLRPLLRLCDEAKMLLPPTMPLNLPIEHTILWMQRKGCSHLRKMFRKVLEFDINNWKHMQNGTEIATQFNVHYAPCEAEKIIKQVYSSITVPHARGLQISIFRNNVLTRKNLFMKQLVETPFCKFCPNQEENLPPWVATCSPST